MTQAIMFFQSMSIFRILMPAAKSKPELKLAVWLKREAEELTRLADREMTNGAAARKLATAANPEKARVFGEIAVWHFKQAAEKYRRAAARFAEAGAIQTGARHEFKQKAESLRQCALEAATAIDFFGI